MRTLVLLVLMTAALAAQDSSHGPYAMQAWGSVMFARTSEGVMIGPQGRRRSSGGCGFVVRDPSVPAYGLVANIARRLTFDGAGFFVGSRWSGAVPVRGTTAEEGRLFLGFNHDGVMCDRTGYDSWRFRNDNAGAFTVQITLTHASRIR